MPYTLGGKIRIELHVQQGRLQAQVYIDDRAVPTSDPLLGGLSALLGGQRPVMGQLSALFAEQLLREESPPEAILYGEGRREGLMLGAQTAIEALPSARLHGKLAVRPDSSLPISLFVAPDILAPLQALATDLRSGWQRMLSAAQSRGQLIDRQSAERILSALCREQLASDNALATVLQVATAEPLHLTARQPLQSSAISYPIDTLRFFADRSPSKSEQSPAVRVRCMAPLSSYGEWLGWLSRGLSAAELSSKLAIAPPAISQFVLDLARAGLLVPTASSKPLHVPPGTIAHLGHATLLANLGGAHVLVDPFLPPASAGDTLRPPSIAELPPLTAILLTHHHWDHVHIESLLKLDKRIPIYIPQQDESSSLRPRTEHLLAYLGFADVRPLRHGASLALGDGGRVLAVPFYGEDPTRLGYVGNCYVLGHQDRAALVHVDSGSDAQGRSLVSSGQAQALSAELGGLSPLFATRRQELGTMVEHTWEFLLRPASEWVQPAENCNNDAAFLASLCQATHTPWLVVYSEGGADFYPPGTDFLRRATVSASMAPYEYLWDPWQQIVAAAQQAGARAHLAEPFELFAIGGGPLPSRAR